jgi:uncharacterized protein
MYYLLFYQDLVDNYVEKRRQWREQHLALACEARDRGELLLAGALDQPMDGAVLLFKGDSPQVAERFARQDPYVVNALVGSWQVRPWSVVVSASDTH